MQKTQHAHTSAHNAHHDTHAHGPARSPRAVALSILCGLFVVYGALDITSRIVLGAPADVVSAKTVVQDMQPTVAAQLSSPETVETPQQMFTAPHVDVTPITPSRVRIPALGITASVEQSGQNGAGHMAAPKRYDTVAWYKYGSRPGAPGNAVIAGHLNNSLGLSGIFERLGTLPLGSEIIVEGDGAELHYVVRQMEVYSVASAPAEEVFSTSGPSQLILITCDGAWDAGVRSYDKRLIVTAELVP